MRDISKSIQRKRLQFYDEQYREYSVNWRDIIFLPFQPVWRFIIMSSIVVSTVVVIYDLCRVQQNKTELTTSTDAFYYFIQIVYLFDTVLTIAHRHMHHYRVTREYKPQELLILMLDVITLLPIYEVHLMIQAVSTRPMYNKTFKTVCKMLSLLRLYKLYLYFWQLQYEVGRDQLKYIFFVQFTKMMIVTYLIAAFWKELACWNCPEKNWSNTFHDQLFDPNSTVDWLILSYTKIGNMIYLNNDHNGTSQTSLEDVIIILVMLIGFFSHFILYFGYLVTAFMRLYRREFVFGESLNSIKRVLRDLNINQKLRKQTIEYYSIFWDQRRGIKDMPNIFQMLPGPLQKEVTVDIYWEAFTHSHFFGGEDLPFKRELSLSMKSEFFVPGEYVLKDKEMRYKMMYIVSGTMQILTSEDNDSPIMSLSSGTLLGEVACFLPHYSTANVRCATYCEIQTLTTGDLYRVLGRYPKKKKKFLAMISQRLIQARKIKSYTTTDAGKQGTSIRWIKKQWKYYSNPQKDTGKEGGEFIVDPRHNSEYLDLIVLTKEVELKMEVICLKGTCPFIMEPNSTLRRYIRYLVVATVSIQSLILPATVVFSRIMSREMFMWSILFDLIYWLDIYVKLSTAIRTKHALISTSPQIVAYRFKHMSFIIDVLASLPVDYIYNLMKDYKMTAYCKLNRLLKVKAIIKMITRQESSVWYDSFKIRMLKYIVLYSITGYWLACFLYMVTCFDGVCNVNGWFYNSFKGERDALNFTFNLVRCLFLTFSICCRMGLSMVVEYTIADLTIHHVLVVTGYLLYNMCAASLTATMVLMLERKKSYRAYYAHMITTLHNNHFSGDLMRQMVDVLQFWWYQSKNEELTGSEGILRDATDDLRNQIVKKRVINCLASTPLFSMLDDDIIDKIVEACTIRCVPPNSEIVTVNSRSTWVHIILRGYCNLVSTVPGDRERMAMTVQKPGDAFPIAEALHQVLTLVNVNTITPVELISIHYTNIIDILNSSTANGRGVSHLLDKHMQTYERILLREKGRMPELIPFEHSLGQCEFFKFKLYDSDERITAELKRYNRMWQSLEKWSFIRYFFFKKTINPSSKYLFVWEVFRCLFAFVAVFIGITHSTLLIDYQDELEYVDMFLAITCVFDFYMRVHVQYYNEIGVLVSHPWLTAKNYYNTAFKMDLYASIPYYAIIRLLEANNSSQTTSALIMIFSRPFQLYRFVGLMDYLQSNVQSTAANTLQLCKYSAIAIVVFAAFAALLQTLTCPLALIRSSDTATCPNKKSWVHSMLSESIQNPVDIFAYSFYLVSSMFLSVNYGSLKILSTNDYIIFLMTFICIFLFKLAIFIVITSARVGGNVNLTVYKERVKSFLKFIKDESIDEDIIKRTIDHYEYMWKQTEGSDFLTTLIRCHPNLHTEVAFKLYGSTLKSVKLFQKLDEGFHKQLCVLLHSRHIIKDSEIIRCNDVQKYLYIVDKGTVEVLLAGTTVATLASGGMFGCFESCGITRQTITVVAKVHTLVLLIESKKFYDCIQKYEAIENKLGNIKTFHQEYMPSMHHVSLQSAEDIINCNANVRLEKIRSKFKLLIHPNQRWYQMWEYVVSFHFALINSIILMNMITKIINVESTYVWFGLLYATDVIYILRIYFNFNLVYTDVESGIDIEDHKKISRRYVRSIRFWIDILTVFPFELLGLLYTNEVDTLKYFTINRVFRFVYLLTFYKHYKNMLNIRTHLKWLYLCYMMTVNLNIMANLWWFIACPEFKCWRLSGEMGFQKTRYFTRTEGIDSLLLCYEYVVNIFTTTGVTNTTSRNLQEAYTTLLIGLTFSLSTLVLLSEFITMVTTQHYSLSDYEYNIRELNTYLEGRELSDPIIKKVWKYWIQLWQRYQGEWIPTLITTAPSHIKQDIMMALYGRHLKKHFLLAHAHIDFLRQLVGYLRRCIFFPGNVLAEKGDMDNSMYFIHEGEVEIFEDRADITKYAGILHKNQSFGEAQGLYDIPHKVSYRARTIVVVLILCKTDWMHLLNWFPASKRDLFKRAAKNNLFNERVDTAIERASSVEPSEIA